MRIFDVNLKEIYPFLGDDGKTPTLTCYLPYCLKEMGRENEKRPCILIMPGGAYKFCSEREAEPVALKFLSWGFNAFVLNYSIAPHRYPAQLQEVAASFEQICAHADEWNCDTDKIGVIGFSAGGHLAADYSNAYCYDVVRKVFPESKRPDFSILCYPVISTDETFAHKGSFEYLLGEFPTGDEAKKYSCEKLVTPDTPPTFIWHTREDNGVPVKNSLCYATALAENNVPFSLHVYPYGCHGLSTCDTLTLNAEDINEKNALTHHWLEDLHNWLKNTI